MSGEPALADKPLYLADGSKTDTLLDAGLPAASQTIIFTNSVGTVAAAPAGAAFDLFQSRYQSEFGKDPANFAFTANGYDAVFVGAAGVVYAAQNDNNNYDGRTVAEGLSHLISGAAAEASGIGWSAIKNGLTSGDRNIDIVGVSGPLDFDVSTGQAPRRSRVEAEPGNGDLRGAGRLAAVHHSAGRRAALARLAGRDGILARMAARKTRAASPPKGLISRSTRSFEHGKNAAGAQQVREGFTWTAEGDLAFALGFPYVSYLVADHPDDDEKDLEVVAKNVVSKAYSVDVPAKSR